MRKGLVIHRGVKELARGAAAIFHDADRAAVRERGFFTAVLSGGRTPRALYELLGAEYRDKIEWGRVHLFWGDERCVPPDNDESNFKMTNLALLSHIPIPEPNVHRVLGENPPEEEAERYGEVIRKFVPASGNGFPRFDWIFLGMGDDGHTASLFPGAPTLKEREKVCVVATHPQTGQKRVSVTFPVLDNGARVSFLVAGADKEPVLRQILEGEGQQLPYPSSMVNPVDGALEWYVDSAAAPWLSA